MNFFDFFPIFSTHKNKEKKNYAEKGREIRKEQRFFLSAAVIWWGLSIELGLTWMTQSGFHVA